ncbi:MAG: phosphoglucomutase [Bacteroidota bacterium]|nr:phosphoglucomutase [Bacteroidota bacterium]
MNASIKFGTDGWRAIVGEKFNEGNLSRVAAAFASYLQEKKVSNKPVAIGFDGRKDSNNYARLFAEILSERDINVYLSSSIIPTPVLSYAVKQLQCSSGIMITASHNPSNYNGVKFKASYGGPFMSEETRLIEQFVRDDVNPLQRSDKRITVTDFLPDYCEHLKTIIDFSALQHFASRPDSNASVMIDSMGGAGQTILEDILTRLGWRAQTIFGEPEHRFYDRSPEPIEKNLGPLLYNTRVTDAVLGLATDGDADRCSVVYEDGKWMTAQENALALLWHLHENKKWNGAVIKSASVTDKVRMLAERWNEKTYDVSVGFKYITEVMLKEDFMFGAEESGGFGFKNHLPERDGIAAGLMFAEMIALSGKSLYRIMDDIRGMVGELQYDRVDVPYDKPDRGEILSELKSRHIPSLGKYAVGSISTFEENGTSTGIKFFCGDSRWLLIRSSQTEPLVRIYAEGQTGDEVKEFLEEGKRLITLPKV